MHHPELQGLRTQLRQIHAAMVAFGTAPLSAKPPILDSSIDLNGETNEEFHSHRDAVHGLRALRDAVKRDLDVLEKFLDDSACATAPSLSTNAPYLISVWNEVLYAPPPIVTIWRTFLEEDKPAHVPRRGSHKPPGVKVDIVADGGRRWIRVNTTKNSRLLAEFREIDSYLTDSEDEDGEGERPSLAQKTFDNSILRVGRSLLDAARRNPLAGTSTIPSITLRFTRLNMTPTDAREYDPRIARTVDLLRDMGIDVELGERDPAQLPRVVAPPVRHLEPTVRVNLDLSILIALVSDITHSPLPTSPAEADARYVPSAQYREWKRKRLEATKGPVEGIDVDESRLGETGLGAHSRALANQALQEMGRGLLQELRDRLNALASPGLENVEFWTTPEARDRCLRIVLSKIGGPNERRRVAALFPAAGVPLSEAQDRYWEDSRSPHAFLPLIPVRVFEAPVPDDTLEPPSLSDDGRPLSPFFKLLTRTCRDILAQETIADPRTTPSSRASSPPTSPPSHERGDDHQCGESASTPAPESADLAEETIERAVVTKANPRLTAHTVQSMLWGAARGWTTLTANKSSVKAILRDIRAAEGGYGWSHGRDEHGQVEGANAEGDSVEGDGAGAVVEKAAIWVVDPRSLAEGMRSDCTTS
ncbi:hypothetical protein BD309DRAFT_896721 [Dichomitus squalens]|uniref:DUF1308 domain-containing protein n=1 Tax=Dichomitus squalens (strain LYAD-421) TaxID=732165 RepID=R7SJZ4_DICSQ|nr:uncharacterized protein DICSQDRAFT_130080 [Dichomitus squalens LYAD-421 SS1]EJF56476.1 hypothetical protein DICSQDRAFT_130080 [Dichomitus squalens LYAD-421 SS1]TBU42201.1 hypothetical protein BD309DRAFT_896721 [Dichomitus squalens]